MHREHRRGEEHPRLPHGEQQRRSELEAQRADGSTFDAVMEFAQASYEGEPCLQIIFRQQVIDPDISPEPRY